MNTPGRLIVLEGPDGVGKTTVAGLVATLQQVERGRAARVVTASAGATEWARRVNEAAHDRDGTLGEPPDPLAFQLAAAACARDGYARAIRPALQAGEDVVCDRIHAVSSLIYGGCAGVDAAVLEAVARATDPPAACWFLLQAPWSVLARRRALGKDVWERRGEDFRALVTGAYAMLGDGPQPGAIERRILGATGWRRPVVLDATPAPHEVARAVLAALGDNTP